MTDNEPSIPTASLSAPPSKNLGGPVLWIGVAILIGFALFLIFMVHETAQSDPRWSRLVYLFSTVEALVWVVVGAIFGVKSQEASVSAARRQATEAEGRATDVADAAELGHVLDVALMSSVPRSARREGSDEGLSEDLIAGEPVSEATDDSETVRHLLALRQELMRRQRGRSRQ